MVELICFLPDPPKSFLSKMKRKIRHYFWTKMPMHGCTWACPRCFFFFFFFFFFHLDVAPSSFFLLFFFFFLIYWAGFLHVHLLPFFLLFFLFSFAFFFVFLFYLDVIFFSRRDFYFLINLGDWFFFGCLSIFWF